MSAQRLMRTIEIRKRERPSDTEVSEAQVSLVLRALADHTGIMDALSHSIDDHPWAHATSVGRWYHDVADVLEG